jgi:hypothetical protein
MRTDDEVNRFMTGDKEQRLGDSLRKAFISSNPNPDRKGCPDPKLMRDLAFHKKIGNPQVFEQVTAHMAECSACVRDALSYAEEYKERGRRHRKARLAMAIAAAAVISVALLAIWRMQPKQEMVAKSPDVPIQSSANPVVADAGNHENKQPEIAQFKPVVIEIPSRWRGTANSENPITLPRARLQLEVRLPIGSSDGKYALRIVDKSGKVQKMMEKTARTVNGITSLKFPLNTSNLSHGDYKLSILEPGVDEWVDYQIAVK